MILDILIATIPERKAQFDTLINKITAELAEFRAHYNIYTDNTEKGVISVGEKRQRLLERATAKYMTFIDDDDGYEEGFLKKLIQYIIVNEVDTDCILTKQLGVIDGRTYYFDIDLRNPIEQLHDNGEIKRQPSVNCVFKTKKAQQSKFPANLSIGEDAKWVEGMNLETQTKINIVGMHYYYDSQKSAANQQKRIAVVSFTKGDRYVYLSEQQKQFVSQYNDVLADYYCFTDESQINSPTHQAIPYAFKPYAIEAVRAKGYNFVIWLDAPVHPVRPLSEAVALIEKEQGVLLVDNLGWTIGDFTSDKCLANLEMTRDEAHTQPMVMACLMAFDFRNKKAEHLFNQYRGWAHENTYGGSWSNTNKEVSQDPRCKGHRHDQSVISILAAKAGRKLLHPNGVIAYKHEPTHKDWITNALFLSGK